MIAASTWRATGNNQCKAGWLKQTIQEFHIVRTPNETPNENGRYCIVYKSNTVYAYNIGVFDTQKQSFTKSYSKDLITNIANVVAWKKL